MRAEIGKICSTRVDSECLQVNMLAHNRKVQTLRVAVKNPNLLRKIPLGSVDDSADSLYRRVVPNRLRTLLDHIDRGILSVLIDNARAPNQLVAETVGIAPSTCLERVRSLRARGVIRRYVTEVSYAALGLPLEALIAVRLQVHSRTQVNSFIRMVGELPNTIETFHMAGVNDFLIHVATSDAEALRDFVLEHLTTHPAVLHTETNLVFANIRGQSLLSTGPREQGERRLRIE